MYKTSEIVKSVREIVAERPEVSYLHVYCHYTQKDASDGSCGCLMGQAIIKRYPELEEKLKKTDNRACVPGIKYLLIEVLKFEELVGVDWLVRVQALQDSGATWGRCVQLADEKNNLPNSLNEA